MFINYRYANVSDALSVVGTSGRGWVGVVWWPVGETVTLLCVFLLGCMYNDRDRLCLLSVLPGAVEL